MENPFDCSVCDNEDCRGCGEYAYNCGIEAERERIKTAICFKGFLVMTDYGHGYLIPDDLWTELFPKKV